MIELGGVAFGFKMRKTVAAVASPRRTWRSRVYQEAREKVVAMGVAAPPSAGEAGFRA